MRAARTGSPPDGPAVRVHAQPRADPLAERVAARCRLGRKVRLEQVAHRDALGREDPAGRQVVEPELRHVERGELRAAALEQRDAEHREVEVVVLGRAVDVLGQARRAAGAVPREALQHLDGNAARREPGRDRPVARGLRELADALARQALDRLAEHAARRAAEPRALDPRRDVDRSAAPRTGSAAARISSKPSGSRSASGRGSSASSSSTSSASARSSGGAASGDAPRGGAGEPPASNQRASIASTSLPSSRACRSS